MDLVDAPPEGDDQFDEEPQQQPPPPAGDEARESGPSRRQNARKRTKTGCLTCRKRRIKCDEGKPTCSNCIKSRRLCEGYTQRVVFKEPIGAFNGGPFAIFHAEPQLPMPTAHLAPAQAKSSAANGSLLAIAPKPTHLDFSAAASFHPGQGFQGPPSAASASGPAPNWSPASASYGNSSISPDRAALLSPQEQGVEGQFNFAQAMDSVFVHRGQPIDNGDAVAQPAAAHPDAATLDLSGLPPVSVMDADIVPPAALQADYEEYWYSDDDESMADSEDATYLGSQTAHLEANDLGVLVKRRLDGHMDDSGTHLRTFANFATENVLASYFPSSSNSPLNDTRTASIFWYFVNVTGPTMSLFERHPVNPSPIFEGKPVAKSSQHTWTYTLPIIALNHPALLQAMLALGSLQMAKLQEVPPTASMKHYHLSLRRLAKNYQSQSRRAQPATLAATLLLGFYEVWNSDHDLWCKHMWGARAILKEVRLAEMTRGILAVKRKRRQRLQELRSQQSYNSFDANYTNADNDDDLHEVDADLLAKLSGQPVSYEELPPVPNASFWELPKRYTERDVEEYELVRDLFWWYCKMDVYQSFLGATRLLMDYSLWTQCTPRAPIGRINAIYGTFDHLMLLLGRLCNFASRDRARKQMAKKPDGPPGAPGPGMSPPLFAGMMPSKGTFSVPTGFSPPRDLTPPPDGPDEIDFEASTKAALADWDSIRQAFETFRAQLGPDFEPLDTEYEPAFPTPFGPPIQYRTYNVAGIWMNYYMGLIVLHRAHPAMPPVAMIAAGMAARQTVPFAMEIGRIAAGLVAEDCSRVGAVSTLVGATLIESSFPLFVSAIQYHSPEQRHWVIKRMHDIARLTGFQSARQIAGGCQAAWNKAASMGHGMPYRPPTDVHLQVPQSVWTRPRRIDERIKELDEDDTGKVVLSTEERPKYALGLLCMQEDLEKLDLRED